MYINSFQRMLEIREKANRNRWNGWTGVDVFNWWMEYDILPGQIDLFEEMEADDD